MLPKTLKEALQMQKQDQFITVAMCEKKKENISVLGTLLACH